MTMKIPVALFVFLCVWCSVNAKCMLYSNCVEVGGFPKPCPYDGDALPLVAGLTGEIRNETLYMLENRCPWLMYDEAGNRIPEDEILTCCDPGQIRSMSEGMLMADGVIGRCPTCLRNFNRQICEMNCSPNQSNYVEYFSEMTEDGIEYANEINYRIHGQYMDDAFESCSGVIVPQTGLPAVNMMCGNAAVCNADSFFKFTGNTEENPMVPVHVNFIRTESAEESMSVRALPCNETYDGDLSCSCVDCLPICPAGNEPVLPEMCTVMSINCISFSVSISVFVICVTIFTLLTLREHKNLNSKDAMASETTQQVNALIVLFQKLFAKIGALSASNSVLMLMLSSWMFLALTVGALNLNLTSSPLELWSSPDSRSRQELNYFNSRFGPFYRAAQVFLQIKGLEPFENNGITYGPAFRYEAIMEIIKLENAIFNIGREDNSVQLKDVCFAPIRLDGDEKLLEQCATMSVGTYFGDSRDNINNNTYLTRIQNCINNYLSLDCLAEWGGGAEPEMAFGGFDVDNIHTADTLLINLPISNHLLEQDLIPVLEWEQKLIDLMHDYDENWKSDFVDMSFGTERSIQDEIERVSEAEAGPIILSYLLMFIYVIIFLGNIKSVRTIFIDSKVTVAVSSIIIVIVAIVCAMGVMGFTGFTTTLLAVNVIPFFILSIGVDNVFLLVNTLDDVQGNLKEYEDFNENWGFEKRRSFVFSKVLGNAGPSMFVASVTQITCFGVGTLSTFPAVKTFALFACLSVIFLFILQITAVVAILSIDYKRSIQGRFDILCCIQRKNDNTSAEPYVGLIKKCMQPYANFILNWRSKIVIAILFMVMIVTSVLFIPRLEVGLDQEMALPTDSYVYKYLVSVNTLMRLGPPVYFVLKGGLDFTNHTHQNAVCGGQLCFEDSLTTQIFLAARFSEITTISRSSNSWLDDFFDWSSLFGACCKFNSTDGGFCQSMDNSPECSYCVIDRDNYSYGLRPAADAFESYIPSFLKDTPNEVCSKGGLASYYSNVNYVLDSQGKATVHDSNFMAYHVPLATSQDFISAVKYGYEVAANITEALQRNTGLPVEVFPYSVFYVFFEQYLTMWSDAFLSIGLCLLGATIINLIASGFNILTTFAVMFTALLVVLNMMGVMYFWDIPLNPVSCINLIVSIGIAVEFCSHIAYAYSTSKAPKQDRVHDALRTVGSTIITGITFTNIPIVVLAFSYTQIIEVFFFRMFISLVILGFLHGMVFFPVLLHYLDGLRKV